MFFSSSSSVAGTMIWLLWPLLFQGVLSVMDVSKTDDDGDDFVPGPSLDAFDWRLCGALADSEHGNIVFSPLSVKLLMKMLYEGSTGASSAELARVLDLPRDKRVSRTESRGKLLSLQVPNSHYVMDIGMKIFVNESISPKYWYQRILYLYYDAYIEKVNFSNSEAAKMRINRWVNTTTHGHIPDLISSGGELQSTVALLVSAVYFKGTWRTPFPMTDSYPGTFWTGMSSKDVLYMTQTNYFYYGRSEGMKYQILRMPYLGRRFSMYLILPEDKNGLDEVIRMIKPEELRREILQMEEASVEVILPRFKFNFETRLKEILRELGIRKVFESYEEMKGLTWNEQSGQFVISEVVQKAAVEVNEKGTEAAAATEAQLTNKFGGSDEIFNASHPFLFFIEDESTATIVFVGKVVHPVEHETPRKATTQRTTTTTTQTTTTHKAYSFWQKTTTNKTNFMQQKTTPVPQRWWTTPGKNKTR